MPLRFSDAATSTLSSSITTTSTSLVLESVASFPQNMIVGDYFICVIANVENTVRETVKVTAINYTTKTFTIQRGYDSTTPIAWPIGSKVEIRGGSALFKEIISSAVSAPTTAINNAVARFDNANNKAKSSLLYVLDDGKVGVNKATPTVELDVVGSVYTTGTIYSVGAITTQGDLTAFQTSDIRLKTNVEVIPNALEKLLKLDGILHNWDTNEFPDRTERDVGVIAQQVEEVLPEIVVTRKNGHKAVRYEKLIPLIIEAIKELNKKV